MLGKHFLHTIAGLFALAFATSLFARGQFWDFLGYTQVESSQDHGKIQITRRDVHFRAIQLRVSGEAIFFDRLVVHFDDGTSQELMVTDRISPGEKTTSSTSSANVSLKASSFGITKRLGGTIRG